MIRCPSQWFAVRPTIRRTVACLLWFLLGGYLIFNKPFAKCGFPPVYIGELVLSCALLATLEEFRSVFIRPLQRSWTYRLIAVLWIYGVVRAATGFSTYGAWALRDSIVTGYAILAFLAPALWRSLFRQSDADSDDLPAHVMSMILPFAMAATIWAALIRYCYFNIEIGQGGPWSETKIDFLSVGTAVAFWACLIRALLSPVLLKGCSEGKLPVVGEFPLATFPILDSIKAPVIWRRERSAKNYGAWLFFICVTLFAGFAIVLLYQLPTRSLWLLPIALSMMLLSAFAFTTMRKILLCAMGGVALVVALIFLPGVGRSFLFCEEEYNLDQNLNFSLHEVEKQLHQNPIILPRVVMDASTTDGENDSESEIMQERFVSIFHPEIKRFRTTQGQQAAHAVRWRASFWLRCYHCTLHQAPWLGVGFGGNLTNLLRNTAAWPLFIPSMSLDPPNRNPHSAHITIFTRLGLVGLCLWLAILGFVLVGALRRCWFHLRIAQQALTKEVLNYHRNCFWNGVGVLGVWTIFLLAMSLGVVLENPFGGMWFWALTGVLAGWSGGVRGETMAKSKKGKDVETFGSLDEMFKSWEK